MRKSHAFYQAFSLFWGVGLPGWEQEKVGGGGHFTQSTDHGVGWGEIKPPVER